MRKKITVVGAGNVGATLVQRIVERRLGDVVMVDVNEGAAQGKALDLMQSAPVMGYDAEITGTANYDATAGSDLIIITAGLARKPGMSRDDLLAANGEIVRQTAGETGKRSPGAVMIVVTNPMDVMAYVAMKATGFPRERVIGMGGVLDSSRFRTFIARELNVSVESTFAYVMGGHGDTMVPLPRFSTVGGVPITELLPQQRIDALVERTRNGGAEIVALLKTGSAYYAPAASTLEIAEAILLDQKKILPCSALLAGEYGVTDAFAGVPVKLGARGMEQVIEVKLNAGEQAAFLKSVEAVKAGCAKFM